MKLQNYIKCLICIIALNLSCSRSENDNSEYSELETPPSEPPLVLLSDSRRRKRLCPDCQCGSANNVGTRRFVAGDFTCQHEFPWLVNIYVEPGIVFTGALINDLYVLTAAAPIYSISASDITVTLGVYDRCTPELSSDDFGVDIIIIHPKYDPELSDHDLALIRLDRQVSFGKTISPICLPNEMLKSYIGERVVTLTGWTITTNDDTDPRSCKPRKITLPKMNHSQCIKAGVNASNFHSGTGCFGVMGVSSFACDNDVGSIVQERTLLHGVYALSGIIPEITRCDEESAATVYSKLSNHLDWVTHETPDACYCLPR